MKPAFKAIILSLLWKAVDVKRRLERPTVVAVTGTVGKTSTKEALAAVLGATGRPVVRTYGNLNTDTGVALSLLGFKEAPRGAAGWLKVFARCLFPPVRPSRKPPIYVLEFSADKPGDIAFLSKRFGLDAAVITAVTPAHMGNYPSFDALVEEKFSILAGLKPGGTAVLNADDPVQVKRAAALKGVQVLWYGCAASVPKKAGVWAHDVKLEEGGLTASFTSVAARKMDAIGREPLAALRVHTSLLGEHQLRALAAAVAVGTILGAKADRLEPVLAAYRMPAGRGRILEGVKDIMIVDDSYNASPESVKAGMAMLRAIAGKRRVVAVIGNMNELGDMEAQAHAGVGAFAAGKVDFFVGVGPNGERMARMAREAGMEDHAAMSFATPERLIDKIDQIVKRKDLVYVKGSQNGVFLERLVKRLMAHPEQAPDLLVRQSKYWYDKHSR